MIDRVDAAQADDGSAKFFQRITQYMLPCYNVNIILQYGKKQHMIRFPWKQPNLRF